MLWDRMTRSVWLPYPAAVLLVLAAAAVRLEFLGILGTKVAYVTFYPAAIIAALIGGLPAGLLATFLSAFIVSTMPGPHEALFISGETDRIGMAVFVLSGILVSCLSWVTHRALIRANEAEAQARLLGERERSAAAIKERENRLSLAIESGGLGTWDLDPVTDSCNWSDRCKAVFGLPSDAIVDHDTFLDCLHPDDRERVREIVQRALDPAGSGKYDTEFRLKWPDGTERSIIAKGRAFFDQVNGERRAVRFMGTVLDVTDQRRAQRENEIALEILKIINRTSGTADLVKAAATFFKQLSGCEAVGIRLKEGDDFPYFEAQGFPEKFVRMENSLCARDAGGNVLRDTAGKPYIECMCGNVILERVDPSKPFFSPGGSFWSNSTTGLLAGTTDEDRQARTRNRCNGEGYESVALIPLQVGAERLGLIQFNDRRKGMFSPEIIALWERLAGYLAVALARSRADEQLREQHEWLQVTLTSVGDAVIATDAAGKVAFVNPVAAALTGRPQQQMLGKPIEEVFRAVDEKTREPAEGVVRRVLREGHIVSFANHTALVTRDGREIPIEESAAPIRDSAGKLRGLVLVFHDVTEKRRAREALLRSEAMLRSVLEQMPSGVTVRDAGSGSLLLFNARGREIMGPLVEGIEQFGRYQGFRCDGTPYRAEEWPVFRSIVNGEVVDAEEMQYERSDGARVTLSISSAPVRDSEGRIIMGVAVFNDISERKSAEAARDKQFQRMNLLNEITGGVLARHDMDSIFNVVLAYLEDCLGIDHSCVWLFDPACMNFSLTAVREKSREFHERIGINEGGTLSIDQLGFAECFEKRTVYIPDVAREPNSLCAKWDHVGMGSMLVAPLAVEGSLLGAIVLGRREKDAFSDEDRRFIEEVGEHVSVAAHQANLYESLHNSYEELRRTQEAVLQQEKLSALGQMASGIVHDINNALGPIVGYTDMLLEFEAEQMTDRVKSGLEMIRTAGVDIANIAAGMRQFYRKLSKQEVLLPIDLNRLIKQIVDLTRPRWKDIPLAQGAVIEVEVDLQEGLPLMGGLESEMREALTNLVFNAADAMPDGGRMTLRTYTSGKDNVVVEVRDSGIGMDEETKRRCLEPFFTTKNEKGTGLGLAMVYGVVQRHGGEMDIISELNKGTTVRLTFPVRESSGLSLDYSVSSSVPSPMKILCIDDEPLQRRLIGNILERDGHTVRVADGGDSGLETFRQAMARRKPFDVVITDLGMPYVDGRQVAATVKRESPGTPVILLTGWGARMHAEGQMPSEVDYMLSKPPMIAKMREALHRAANLRPRRN